MGRPSVHLVSYLAYFQPSEDPFLGVLTCAVVLDSNSFSLPGRDLFTVVTSTLSPFESIVVLSLVYLSTVVIAVLPAPRDSHTNTSAARPFLLFPPPFAVPGLL